MITTLDGFKLKQHDLAYEVGVGIDGLHWPCGGKVHGKSNAIHREDQCWKDRNNCIKFIIENYPDEPLKRDDYLWNNNIA